ncbi:dual specificity protein phosphatase Mpk3-like isoform X1 [Trichogramma pretiosum]|uniref:dual specificity protein phosphatase Mpk3-like isoform X1 n=1 Tax=Trichogramma pretiosum TaxID=7493 RepID=UPI0006C98CDA|nr:dual specificity protein phosphatase Mpk3-like isoform X1 [Trichogramma pretiosum]
MIMQTDLLVNSHHRHHSQDFSSISAAVNVNINNNNRHHHHHHHHLYYNNNNNNTIVSSSSSSIGISGISSSSMELVSGDWLRDELARINGASSSNNHELLVIDCRGQGQAYAESRVRGSVALAIPTIMLRRLAAGKVDLLATIKCQELRSRVERMLKRDDDSETNSSTSSSRFVLVGDATEPAGHQAETIAVLAKRLECCGAQVALLEGGFGAFKDRYPEWCEGTAHHDPTQTTNANNATTPGGGAAGNGAARGGGNDGAELMGLRSLRISAPPARAYSDSDSDSTCDSIGPDDDKDFPVEIVPHLYLGNAANSEDSEALTRHGIQYVLNVTPDLPNVFEDAGSIKYMKIPISDHWSANLASFFPQAIQFIEEARSADKGVLVHCLAGISRSVTVTMAYLMHKCNLSLNDAFNLVRSRKSNIAPNFHFMEQLHSFEGELRDLRQQQLMDGCGSSSATDACVSSSSSSSQHVEGGVTQQHHLHEHYQHIQHQNHLNQINHQHSHSHSHHHHHHHKKHHQQAKSCQSCPIGQQCSCPTSTGSSFLSPLDMGLSPDSGIEFDRWASSTPAD